MQEQTWLDRLSAFTIVHESPWSNRFRLESDQVPELVAVLNRTRCGSDESVSVTLDNTEVMKIGIQAKNNFCKTYYKRFIEFPPGRLVGEAEFKTYIIRRNKYARRYDHQRGYSNKNDMTRRKQKYEAHLIYPDGSKRHTLSEEYMRWGDHMIKDTASNNRELAHLENNQCCSCFNDRVILVEFHPDCTAMEKLLVIDLAIMYAEWSASNTPYTIKLIIKFLIPLVIFFGVIGLVVGAVVYEANHPDRGKNVTTTIAPTPGMDAVDIPLPPE